MRRAKITIPRELVNNDGKMRIKIMLPKACLPKKTRRVMMHEI